MKVLKITIEYGNLMIPREGRPFVDSSDNIQVVTMPGELDKLDGEVLGKELFKAIGAIAAENQD